MLPDERIAKTCEIFIAARSAFRASLPEGFSVEEVKRLMYFRTYDEHLPNDFFTR